MTSTAQLDRKRQPKGVTIGGQFATEPRAESDVALAAPVDENPFTKRYDTLEEKLDAIHGELSDRIEALADDENWRAWLDMASRFHHYSLYNQLLIAVQRPDATRVAGYRKWEEFGRHVKKGEKGITILRPKMVQVPVVDSAGKPILDDKGKPKKETKVVGFSTATVFDVSQTEGDPLPELKQELSTEPPAGFIEDLERAITARGFTVSYADALPGGARGQSSPDGKVTVLASLSPAMRAKVLAHELGHIAAGHLDRLDEYHTGHGGARGGMEVEAESIAYTLCRANGMSTEVGDVSGTYVAGWARVAEEGVVKKSAQTVSKTVKSLLSEGTWTNAEEA